MNTRNKTIEAQGPNKLWVCDLIGRLQSRDGSNKFIFVAIDHCSKWIETRILGCETAGATAKAIEDLIIAKHVIPNRILSDNGLEFKNTETDDLARKYGIDRIFNSLRAHETVGAVERVNKKFMEKLRKLCNLKNSRRKHT